MQQASAPSVAAPGFDLSRAGQSAQRVDAAPAIGSAPRAVVQPSTPEPSVADAFADLGTAKPVVTPSSREAVDLAVIKIPREKPPAAEPPPPAHPSRIWVQLATGSDVDALRFDWRRFSRKAPAELGKLSAHVTPWGQANRLLVGPLKSREAQRELINALNAQGIDTFGYVSPEGTEITPLK